jgi:hypothetical protein
MKQLIALFITFLIGNVVLGQIENKLVAVLETHDLSKLKSFVSKYQQETVLTRINVDLSREIVPEFMESVFKVTLYEAWHEGFPVSNEERLNLITKNNLIVYYYYEKKTLTGYPKVVKVNTDTIYRYSDSVNLNRMCQSFEKIFNNKLNQAELFIDTIYWGAKCGHMGQYIPVQHTQIAAWVSKKDTASLTNWLRATNTETQIYALQGFKALLKKGFHLNKETLNQLVFIANKKGTINTCGSCSSDLTQIRSVVKEIDK